MIRVNSSCSHHSLVEGVDGDFRRICEQKTVHPVEIGFLKLPEFFKYHVEVYNLYTLQCKKPT